MTDAVVVGAGPNGLAAAVALAQAGLRVTVLEGADEIGGGTRTAELTVPGVKHDVCSAIHPLGVASPFFSSLPLHEHGLTWRWPEIDVAHPLDDGTAGVLLTSLDATADRLGSDGKRWRAVFGPLVEHIDELTGDVLGPMLKVPGHPVGMLRFGLRAGLPATVLGQSFRTERARALFAGCAAHVYRPLSSLASSAVAAMMIATGHRHGWPVAEGGSMAISRALAGLLESLGGSVVTGTMVRSLRDLPAARVALFDVTPTAFVEIADGRLPPRRARAYRRYKYGPAAYKLDLAVREGVPWTAQDVRRAGTVHVGGSAADIAQAEADVGRGRMPERPYLLVGQQYVADPTRSVGDVHPVWVYAHVPNGYGGDATDAMLRQMERFAPGLRDRIVASHTMTPADLQAYNPNYVGGDIAAGLNSAWQLIARPVLALDNYSTGIPGMFLCSAATPPGGGAHGMCGFNAARRALAYLGMSTVSGPTGSGPPGPTSGVR
jgi:phytoene dehydrogenase-like protein